jgi:tellurite resistance protein TerC
MGETIYVSYVDGPAMFWIWTGFIVFVLALLALDLGVFNRKAHVIGVKEALGWSALWIALGLLFSIFIYFAYENRWMGIGGTVDDVDGVALDGRTAAVRYLTGYVVEKSLSIDNIFVIAMIFRYFAVPAMHQHRVLFWGIVGALAMRGAMIAAGAALIHQFHWILYVFGAFLLLTAAKMFFMKSDHGDPGKNPIVRLVRRYLPVTDQFHGEHFFVRERPRQKWMLTPLAMTLVVVETTDLVFAVDSIPAIFAITADAFLVFTSNVFAMLGLRSLYFALAEAMQKFRYLKYSLAAVLAVVGVKMLAAEWFKELLGKHFNFYLLGVIGVILAAGVGISLLHDRSRRRCAKSLSIPSC